MPTEAPEHAGPIVIWRKELRPGAGADGAFRSGLSQVLEIAPPDGHEFSAMFDRTRHAPRRNGGNDRALGVVKLDDGPQDVFQRLAARACGPPPGAGTAGQRLWQSANRTAAARAEDRPRGYVMEKSA